MNRSHVRSLRKLFRAKIHATTPAEHLVTGKRGERIAAGFLRRKGLRVLGQNLRVGDNDEIDILAIDPLDHVLVFAEVKTRRRIHDDYDPLLNITPDKYRRMVRAAEQWVDDHQHEQGWRLDVICVAAGKVALHLEDVASWE